MTVPLIFIICQSLFKATLQWYEMIAVVNFNFTCYSQFASSDNVQQLR